MNNLTKGLLFVLFALLVAAFMTLLHNIGKPAIELHNGIIYQKDLGDGKKFNAEGTYYWFMNKIDVNVESSDPLWDIYHEYGHYLYKRISKSDKAEWNNNFCFNFTRKGYGKKELCEEEFSDGFADRLTHYMNSAEQWDYFDNITRRWLE